MCSLLANPLFRVSLFLSSISITWEFIQTLLKLHHCTCYFPRGGPFAVQHVASLSAMKVRNTFTFYELLHFIDHILSLVGFSGTKTLSKTLHILILRPLVALVIFSKFSSTAHTDNVGIRFGHFLF